MSNNQSKIIVSICCITYNHAPFIRKALDGFLMQQAPSCVPQGAKMSDWCEILIHDDCSTDGTTEIVKEYAVRYPDLIFPLYEQENQYSHGGAGKMDFYNYKRARGTYIAYCEGDDYWTDPLKLQKQVDFMETHPDYSICTHGCTIYDVRTGEQHKSRDFAAYNKATNKNADGIDFTASDYFKGNYGQPLTMLFRLSMFDFKWQSRYRYYRDTHEIYHLTKAGKGHWLNFDGGVYNKHDGGVSTSVTLDRSVWEEREHVAELYLHNRSDLELRRYLIRILLWNYDVHKNEGREQEFFKIIKTYWKTMPFVAINVYWVIFKRTFKKKLRK